MVQQQRPDSDEVTELLRNAQLRDELEPYVDEAITHLRSRAVPTPVENEYLASMLAWERAPVLPISRWFDPELTLPQPDKLSPAELRDRLEEVISKLHEKHVVLDFTDHLSDRDLYLMILRDILPSHEKMVDRSEKTYLHWDCANVSDNPEAWLRYYATDMERQAWVDQTGGELPVREVPPYPRNLPHAPF